MKLVYDYSPYISFNQLLVKDKLVNINQRNLQFLATEILRVKVAVSTGLIQDIFQFVKPYDLRNNSLLLRKRNKAVFYVTESLSSLAPKIWELIPQ